MSYYPGSTVYRTITHKQECRIIKVPLNTVSYYQGSTAYSVVLSRFHCRLNHNTQTRMSYYQGTTAYSVVLSRFHCMQNHNTQTRMSYYQGTTEYSVVLSRFHSIQCRIIKDLLHQCLSFKFLPLLVITCMVVDSRVICRLLLLCSVLVLLGVTSGWRLLNQTQVNACMPM